MKQGVRVTGQYLDEAQNVMVDVEMDLTNEQAEAFGLTRFWDYSVETRPRSTAHYTVAEDGTVTQNVRMPWLPEVEPWVRDRLAQVLREVQG